MVILLNKKALEEKMHFLQEFFFFFGSVVDTLQ